MTNFATETIVIINTPLWENAIQLYMQDMALNKKYGGSPSKIKKMGTKRPNGLCIIGGNRWATCGTTGGTGRRLGVAHAHKSKWRFFIWVDCHQLRSIHKNEPDRTICPNYIVLIKSRLFIKVLTVLTLVGVIDYLFHKKLHLRGCRSFQMLGS